MSEALLEGVDLEKTYDMGDRGLKVLRGVSVEVRSGEILAIQGPSGAGKSTLLHLLGLLDEPDGGRVVYRGQNILALSPRGRSRFRNEKIGFVFQFYHLFPDLTALENICLPKMVGVSTLDYRGGRAEIEARARGLLARMGLTERATHLPSELSGGERQRVAIARALMNEPEILLCDEPTGNLDQKTAGEILDVLWKLNAETGQTFVIVTHDEVVARRAHRVIRMVDGVISDGGPVQPRGYAETKFRRRESAPVNPFAAGALAAAVPVLGALIWIAVAFTRFRRATRRGSTAFGTVLAHLVPLLAIVPQALTLAAANRLLMANGEKRLPVLAPAVVWGLVWAAAVACLAAAISRDDPNWLLAAAGAQLAAGAAAAWIQSLHNAFFDRMQREGNA